MSDMDVLLRGGFQPPAATQSEEAAPVDQDDALLARINSNLKKLSPTGAAFARARMKSKWGWAPPTDEEATILRLESQKKVLGLQKDIASFMVSQARGAILDNKQTLTKVGVNVDDVMNDPEQFATVAQKLGFKDMRPGMLAVAEDPTAMVGDAERTTKKLSTKAAGQGAAESILKTRREVAAGAATNKAGEPVSEFGTMIAQGEESRGLASRWDDPIDKAPGAAGLVNLSDELVQNPVSGAFGGPSELASILVQRQGPRVAEQLKNLPTNEKGQLLIKGDAGVDDEAVFRLVSWVGRMAYAQGKPVETVMADLGLKYTGIDDASYLDMAQKIHAGAGGKEPFETSLRSMLLGPWGGPDVGSE